MPFSTIREKHGIEGQFSGELSFAEIMVAIQEAWESPDWGRCRFQIMDFLNVEKIDVRDDQAALIAYMDRASSASVHGKMRIALIADQAAIVALINIYNSTLDIPDWDSQHFRDLAAARQWAQSDFVV